MSKIQHNLDIQTYNLDELLSLFDLSYDLICSGLNSGQWQTSDAISSVPSLR